MTQPRFRISRRALQIVPVTAALGAVLHLPAMAQTAAETTVGESVQEVIVTGSRIRRAEVDSPSPLVVADREMIETSGFTTIDDVLLTLPQIGAGIGGSNQLYDNDDAGAAFVDLRGLGTNRSLVVVNGRRRVSGSRASSRVDLNTIPASMIERVEVISGGASAIYGADAVSGVVNVITKSDFEGLSFSANGGISDKGDAENWSVAVHGGTAFADGRGHVNIGLTYSKREELLFKDRSFASKDKQSMANPANTGPNDGIFDRLTYDDIRISYITPDANFFLNNTNYLWTANGLDTVRGGEVLNSGALGHANGGNGGEYLDYLMLRSPLEVTSLRSDVKYELLSNVRFFGEAEFTTTDSDVRSQYYRFDQRTQYFAGYGAPRVRLDNPFLPAPVAALMAANNLTEMPIRKELRDELGALHNIHDRYTYTLVGGFEGTFNNGWNWQAFHQYGQYVDNTETTNLIHGTRFIAATDVITDPATGEPVCRSTTARASGCVPVNLFVREPFSQAQRDYFVRSRLQDARTSQTVTGAQLTGDLFSMPAGPVGFAAGVEQRTETLETTDDGLALAGELQFYGVVPRPPVDEEFKVSEAFVEVLVPVLRDLPFVRSLNVEGAVRLSDYSTIGDTTAWRGALNWKLDDNVRLRYTRSSSVRAPNLFELYAPTSARSNRVSDPCAVTNIDARPNRRANCLAMGIPINLQDNQDLTLIHEGGNPDLKEETSNSYTLGLVLTPQFLRGLSMSIDYYNIRIEGAVSRFGADTVASRCFDANSIDNPFCDLLTLGPDHRIEEVRAYDINVGYLQTSGIDLDADYRFGIDGVGDFGVRLMATYLIEKDYKVVLDDPNTLIIQAGEYVDPRFLLKSTLSYNNQSWRASVSNRYISESWVDRQALPEAYDRPRVSDRIYTDLRLGYDWSKKTSVFLGVNNVMDTPPPNVATGRIYAGILSAVRYDNIGRYFHMGLKYSF